MSLLLLFKRTGASAAGGSIGAPASLPSLAAVLYKSYTLTAAQGTYSVSGQDAGFLRGYSVAADQGSYTVSGQSAALGNQVIFPVDQGSYAVTGQDVTFSRGYVLAAQQGAYDVIGEPAGTIYSGDDLRDSPAPLPSLGLLGGLGYVPSVLASAQGSYGLTGQDVAFSRTYIITADSGAYSSTGQVVNLDSGGARAGDPAPLPHLGLLLQPSGARVLTADAGIYNITGSDGLADFEVTADQGSYTLTGQDAALNVAHVLTADQGSYTVAGQDSTYSIGGANRSMAADFGTYTLTGQAAGTLRQYPLTADQGFYALLGQAATFGLGVLSNYTLTADSGTYSHTGQDAGLTKSQPILACDTGYYGVQGFDLPGPSGVVPAGRKRKRKTEVEIDGQVFDVRNKEEAAALLQKAREAAEETAKLAIERAAKAQKRPTRKVLADARKALQVPEVDADEVLREEVERFRSDVQKLYQDALQAVEIAALLRKAQDEEDDEDVLLLLA